MRIGIVRVGDVLAEGCRLTGSFHVSEDQHALASLRRLNVPKPRVADLVRERGVFRGPIFTRIFVESGGEPYMSPSDIPNADARPAGYLSPRHGRLLEDLRLHDGMILVTCSGMNLGSVIWADRRLDGIVASHDLIRIEPDPALVPPGFLFAFLASRHGHTLIRKQIYGGHIKHIEPHHVANLQVPRLGRSIESRVNALIAESAKLMVQFQSGTNRATSLLFESVGLADISAADWHLMGRDLGFSEESLSIVTLRSLNYRPRFLKLVADVKSRPFRTLAALCDGGLLGRGGRYRRVDAEPGTGVQMIGQRDVFAVHPAGRWISRKYLAPDVIVPQGTTLIAGAGTFGESELYCRAEYIQGVGVERAYSELFVRALPGTCSMPSGTLFAFLRSETAFRMLRAISFGTKLQYPHPALLRELPIPYPGETARDEVHRLVVDAYEARHKAAVLEERAVALVEDAIETGAH